MELSVDILRELLKNISNPGKLISSESDDDYYSVRIYQTKYDDVCIKTCEAPFPVEIPELKYKFPPDLFVSPDLAPPAIIYKRLPIAVVLILSTVIVLSASPPNDIMPVGAAFPVPIPKCPLAASIILRVGALSVVPVDPAVAVKKSILLDPVPVDVPELNTKSPPFKSVPPDLAPPESSVKLFPAVADVV